MATRPGHRSVRRPRPGRAYLVAVAGPAMVTLLAVPEDHPPGIAVAVLYVLAVVLAAGLGGASAGVAASVLSFLTLNFFFTPPLHTFVVGTLSDLVALLVFLTVSVIVGLLLSSSLAEKSRAEQREVEARLLNQLATQLLTGDPVEKVLGAFVTRACDVFGLARCEINTSFSGVVANDAAALPPNSQPYSVDLTARGQQVGTLRVWPTGNEARLDPDEREAIRAFAGQLALALESMRLSVEVRRAELEAEANQLKATLFSGVTHDVKTPLAAITASVTSLADGARFTPQQRQEHLEIIKQEVDRLDRVVNNLLDLARLRAGAIIPLKSPSPMEELIESVVARLRPVIGGRHVELRLKDDLPEVPMDVVQIDQVLSNLIENALKFSPPDTALFVTNTGHAGGVRVTIADRGPGVPKAERERIFEPFERAGSSASGSGLGLAIAKAIITAHGGRLWVADAPGGGAAFTFELPTGEGTGAGVTARREVIAGGGTGSRS